MIISKQKGFIFFAAGKTGTTSIENVLRKYEDYQISLSSTDKRLYDKHIPPYFAKQKIDQELWNNSYKFCFVRNPWDWCVSRWKFNIRKWNLPVEDKITVEIIDKIMEINSPSFRGISWLNSVYQFGRMSNPDGELLVDYVGKYEKLQEDFDEVCKAIDLPITNLPHVNQSAHARYTEYFTPQTQQYIYEKYKKDINYFGYKYGE